MAAYKYLITDKKEFSSLVDYIDEAPIFAYDTETNGSFSRFKVQMVGMSFGFDDFACYIPLMHMQGDQLPINYVLDALKPIFENPSKRYVAHNAKFDEMVLKVHGIYPRGSGDDTYVMAWLLNEDRGSKGLKALTKQYLGIQMETYDDVISRGKKLRGVDRDYNFGRVLLQDALSYASDDAYFTLELYNLFSERLRAEKLLPAYEKIERPLIRIVGDLEWAGVNINRELLKEADHKLPELAQQIEAEIYEEAGEVFKIGSPQQLGRILFDKLAIGNNVPKTKTGNYCTDKKTLKTYAGQHKVVENILRRKKIQKTHSTFVEGLKGYVEKDGKIHPSFNSCGTVTGRFAGRSPNLQQIEGDEVESIKIRNFFIPSTGCDFVVGDYSQIELRILAHSSNDENMIKAFLSGKDFHDETARLMLALQGKAIAADAEVQHRDRFNAKMLNFGIPYGRGPGSVAEQLGVPPRCDYWPEMRSLKNPRTGKSLWWSLGERLEAPCHECGKCFIEDWFAGYPGVRLFKQKVIRTAQQRGYIRTLAGRKRRLPDIHSKNPMLRSAAERQAFNTEIQGSAADIIKLAMVEMSEPLKKLGAQMILQIHDELVVESPVSTSEDVVQVMKEKMEKPLNGRNPLRLPMLTDPKIVMRWGDAK